MAKFKVRVTRDMLQTQSQWVTVEADSADDAEQKAIDLREDDIAWEDNDNCSDSEGGIYVADPSEITMIAGANAAMERFKLTSKQWDMLSTSMKSDLIKLATVV